MQQTGSWWQATQPLTPEGDHTTNVRSSGHSPSTIPIGYSAPQIAHLTFSGPRIVIYSYNESQRDALFLKFI